MPQTSSGIQETSSLNECKGIKDRKEGGERRRETSEKQKEGEEDEKDKGRRDENCQTSLLDLRPEFLTGLLSSFHLSSLIPQLLNYENYFHN